MAINRSSVQHTNLVVRYFSSYFASKAQLDELNLRNTTLVHMSLDFDTNVKLNTEQRKRCVLGMLATVVYICMPATLILNSIPLFLD